MSLTQFLSDLKCIFTEADKTWIKRHRLLNTATVFDTLYGACTRNRGLVHIIAENQSKFSDVAIHNARVKIPLETFKKVNTSIIQTQKRVNSSRIFAVDGSKVHVHPSFEKYGYKTRTNDVKVTRPAKRPLVMLSALVDVKTKLCHDFVMTKHFNERAAALVLAQQLIPGDTMVFDRGYYSKHLSISLMKMKLKFVFRLKKDAFKSATTFYNSKCLDMHTILEDESEVCMPVRLVKYFIDGRKYMCLTNIMTESRSIIKSMYGMRWEIELAFKRLKSNLKLEYSHSMSPVLYNQEVEMRVLMDTLTLLLQERGKAASKSNGRSKKNTYLFVMDVVLKQFIINLQILAAKCRRQGLG